MFCHGRKVCLTCGCALFSEFYCNLVARTPGGGEVPVVYVLIQLRQTTVPRKIQPFDRRLRKPSDTPLSLGRLNLNRKVSCGKLDGVPQLKRWTACFKQLASAWVGCPVANKTIYHTIWFGAGFSLFDDLDLTRQWLNGERRRNSETKRRHGNMKRNAKIKKTDRQRRARWGASFLQYSIALSLTNARDSRRLTKLTSGEGRSINKTTKPSRPFLPSFCRSRHSSILFRACPPFPFRKLLC